MKRSRKVFVGSLVGVATLAAAVALALTMFAGNAGASPNPQSNEVLHGAHLMNVKGACHHNCGGGSNNLTYHNGTPGVERGADKVYLVYWGSQWNGNDPTGEAAIQQSFFGHVGGSSWNNSVTQYYDTAGNATNPTGVLAGTWYDNAAAAPSRPSQSQLAAEAANAATHFGNTTATANSTVQYVINTATGNNASGFGTQYCAWHSSTSSSSGTLAYTNMPYITDAGASCGAGFNGLGPNAGITIVGGHEFAETETDIFPNGGWLDSGGAENGDKCASANVTMNGASFPVQSLWSNAFNSGAGGCVLAY